MLGEEVGQVNIVTTGRAGAKPLRIADNHVECIALGVEFGKSLGLEIRPWRCLDRDRHAGFGGVQVGQFLQIVCRIPFRPEDGQFFRLRGGGECAGQGHCRAQGQRHECAS